MYQFEDIHCYLSIQRRNAAGTWRKVKENTAIYPSNDYRIKIRLVNTQQYFNKDFYMLTSLEIFHPNFEFFQQDSTFSVSSTRRGTMQNLDIIRCKVSKNYYIYFRPTMDFKLVPLAPLIPKLVIHYHKIDHNRKDIVVYKTYD